MTDQPALPDIDVDDDDALVGWVNEYYAARLARTPHALEYLARRGLGDAEFLRRFRVGVSDRNLGKDILPKRYKAGRYFRARLVEVGILRASGHEHLRGSITFPIFRAPERFLDIVGRRFAAGIKPPVAPHLRVWPTRPAFWNEPALTGDGDVLLCEGVFDAGTFVVQGFERAVAVLGTRLEVAHVEALVRHRVRRVLVAFDRDKEGEAGFEQVVDALAATRIEVGRLVLPDGRDVNAYACSKSDPREALDERVRHALWTPAGLASVREPRTRSHVAVDDTADVEGAENLADAKDAEDTADTEDAEAPRAKARGKRELARELEPPHEPPPRMESLPPREAAPELEPERGTRAGAPPDLGRELVVTLDDRRWRVRGLAECGKRGGLRLNLLVTREGAGFHVDVFDLYSARQRNTFVRLAAVELGLDLEVLKQDMGRILMAAELALDELRAHERAPREDRVEISAPDREAALALLADPDLLARVVEDFGGTGVVGEHTNLLLGYLAAVSRKLERPLALLVQSSSAAGKSSLMDAVLSFVPAEERVVFSAMTGQSLYYMGSLGLRHKVLSIAEEEGISEATYALKILQSAGGLTIASTGKDPDSGRLTSHEYKVEGPVAVMLTTTALDVDEELLSRCVVVTVDESAEQTARIHERQRFMQSLDGLAVRERADEVRRLHQNAQRLLRPLRVVNPFAHEMTFADLRVRARRDHQKLLGLVEVIALVHQYQREVKTLPGSHGSATGPAGRESFSPAAGGEEPAAHAVEYIEVEEQDIDTARRLLDGGARSRLDDLPPQTARMLARLTRMVGDMEPEGEPPTVRFSRREVRERLGVGNTQARVHLTRLVDAEYVMRHKSAHGRGVRYSVTVAASPGGTGSGGLEYEGESAGQVRPKCGPKTGGWRTHQDGEIGATEADSTGNSRNVSVVAENGRRRDHKDSRRTVDGGDSDIAPASEDLRPQERD